MSIAKYSIERPIAISMMVAGIILLGIVSLQKIPLNLLPDITYPKITIRTEYPHAAPREVEERVTKYIESAVGIIQNVVKVSSVSRPGWSDVYVEFKWGSDVDIISMDIREKIQLLENILPEEVGRPILLRYDPNQDPIVVLAVGGEGDLADVRRWVEMNVELELERLEGVAAVKVEGGYEDEILIELDERKLDAFGLSMSTISDRLNRENVNLAAGSIEEGGSKIAVRTVNRFASLEDIRELIVSESQTGSKSSTGGVSALSSLGGGMGGGMSMGGGSGLPPGLMGLLGGLGGNLSSLTGGTTKKTTEPTVTSIIRIKDIGTVSYRHKDRTEIARLNGNESIKVSIYKEGDANIVSVADQVRQAVRQIRERHRVSQATPEEKAARTSRPFKKAINTVSFMFLNYQFFRVEEEKIEMEQGVQIVPISDQSVFIMQSIMSVAQNAVMGSIFAIAVLYFFLRNWSSTMIVGIAIPISFIATFNLMYFNNISFNIMSLGGLALGVGVLVDNSIIVIENILRHRTFTVGLRESAQKATDEISMPVISGTLTNCIVFLPILYLEGMFRQIFGDLAWTVTFSTLTSAATAITIVPMLSVVLGNRVKMPKDYLEDLDLPPGALLDQITGKEGKAEKGAREQVSETGSRSRGLMIGCLLLPVRLVKGIGGLLRMVLSVVFRIPLRIFDWAFRWIRHHYPIFLRRLLGRPFAVGAISIIVAGGSLGMLYLLGWELLPPVDQGEFRIRVELPTGTPIEQTSRRLAEIEKKIRSVQHGNLITSLFTTVGLGTAEGEGSSEKSESLGEIHVALEGPEFRNVKDDIIISEVMAEIAGEVNVSARSSKPQMLSFKAPIEIEIIGSNLEQLDASAREVINRITPIKGLIEIQSSLGEQNPEINISIDRERASALGLNVSTIIDVIRRKVNGQTATRYDHMDQQLDVVLEIQKQDRGTVEKLKGLSVPGPNGDIKLAQIAAISPSFGPATITRVENSRVALIRANISGRPLGDVIGDIQKSLDGLTLPGDAFWRITGQNEEMERSLPSLYMAITLAIILVYILLASEFESLAHPFVIMFTVPFGLVGMATILLLSGQTINIFTLIGILMMIGILDNVAIVLVSAINGNRDAGMERVEAIIAACQTRLRPIMITNLTTILGMVPMAIAFGPGTELSAPMAITVIGGLTSATFLTLLTLPCLYLVLDKILPRSYKPRRDEPESSSPVEPPAPATPAPVL